MGIEGTAEGVRARIHGDRVSSLAELAAVLPVQIIDPEIHRLIEEGPSRRRQFLDWGVFHVEPQFVTHWQKYQQALRQRNAALRARQPQGMVSAWDGELIRYGELLSGARRRYITRLEGEAQALCGSLLKLELTLGYRAGWPPNEGLGEALARSWNQDQEFGTTQVGPQRAELTIRLAGIPVKDRISRGQQKLLAAALLISQLKMFPSDAPVRPTLLLDDPAAELDEERLGSLIQEVRAQTVQIVVTTLHGGFPAFGEPGRHYVLDSGAARPVAAAGGPGAAD
jgi:DNA replication and repair protein RecF